MHVCLSKALAHTLTLDWPHNPQRAARRPEDHTRRLGGATATLFVSTALESMRGEIANGNAAFLHGGGVARAGAAGVRLWLARFFAGERRLHQSRVASAAARVWSRRAAEDREGSRRDFRRCAPRRNDRCTDRDAHRESRLGELGEDSSRRSFADLRSRGAKIGCASARSCGPGGFAE